MKKHVIVLASVIFLFALPAIGLADGISVTPDLKHVQGEHVTFKLTKTQINDVERLRKATLTKEQHAKLKKINPKVPSEVTVLSSRWDSCTCGVCFYAVWCRKGEIDIPLYEIQYADKSECTEDDNIDNSEQGSTNIGKAIILDSSGTMFVKGKMITEKDLYKAIDKIAVMQVPRKKVWKFVYMDTPPPINDRIDKKIEDLATRVNSYCIEKKISFSALGLHINNSVSQDGD